MGFNTQSLWDCRTAAFGCKELRCALGVPAFVFFVAFR
jgi:hypothetical protein